MDPSNDEIVGTEIDVFATNSTVAVLPDELEGGTDAFRRGGDAIRAGIEHARSVHARPGPRPGARPITTSARRGGDCDIVRPVLVDPVRAAERAARGALFDRPLPHLELGGPAASDYLTWSVVVTGDRRVPATLHLLASPSLVVTVLELVPRRRIRWGRDRFLLDGIAAVDDLADVLLSAAASEAPARGRSRAAGCSG